MMVFRNVGFYYQCPESYGTGSEQEDIEKGLEELLSRKMAEEVDGGVPWSSQVLLDGMMEQECPVLCD